MGIVEQTRERIALIKDINGHLGELLEGWQEKDAKYPCKAWEKDGILIGTNMQGNIIIVGEISLTMARKISKLTKEDN